MRKDESVTDFKIRLEGILAFHQVDDAPQATLTALFVKGPSPKKTGDRMGGYSNYSTTFQGELRTKNKGFQINVF